VSLRSAGHECKNECAATVNPMMRRCVRLAEQEKQKEKKERDEDETQTRENRVSKQQNDAGAFRLRLLRDTDPRVGWRKESGQWTGDSL
jgi:Na+-translocating ferredoxin:NAD+ oxidoreductase RnfC subunit